MSQTVFQPTREEEKVIQDLLGDPGFDWGSLKLESFKKLKQKIKTHYISAQNYTCCYCKQEKIVDRECHDSWDLEHVIARNLVPDFVLEPANLAISCKACNRIKGKKEVRTETGKYKKKFPKLSADYHIVHPHFDVWKEHITRFDLLYSPKTAKGSSTIVVCKLYRYVESRVCPDIPQELLDKGGECLLAQNFSEQKKALRRMKAEIDNTLDDMT